MHIHTSRFGLIHVDDDRIATFPRGLVGFGDLSRFALVTCDQNERFTWLQSLDDGDVAFLMVNPTLFFRDYTVGIREETQTELQLAIPQAGLIFVICNKVGDWLTGNLLGPIVVNAENRARHSRSS